MRIAFFGGSFDPPHIGHLAIARAAREALRLDQLLFAPVGLQPLKSGGSSASFSDRVAMTRLAIEHEPSFHLSLADAPASPPAPNYTIDTLHHIHATFPNLSELYLLLGADAFLTLHHWHRAAEIPFAAQLIVASRPHSSPDPAGDPCALSNPAVLAASLPAGVSIAPMPLEPNRYRLANSFGTQSTLTILPNLDYDISATELRAHLQNPLSSHPSLIPPAVLDYIHQHHLYTGAS